MTTFLNGCKRLRSESDMTGTGPASVEGQSGESLLVVEWYQSAYEDIQNQQPMWKFLQSEFTFQTISSQQAYTPTEAGLPNLNLWGTGKYGGIRVYTAISDEQYLTYIPWDVFRRTYLFGTARAVTGKPTYFSIKPDKSIIFYPIPDAVYTIDGEYFKKAVALDGNTDEPIFPSQFHMIIVWRALMLYGAFDAASERYSHGQNEYKKLLGKLMSDQGPRVSWGKPLV